LLKGSVNHPCPDVVNEVNRHCVRYAVIDPETLEPVLLKREPGVKSVAADAVGQVVLKVVNEIGSPLRVDGWIADRGVHRFGERISLRGSQLREIQNEWILGTQRILEINPRKAGADAYFVGDVRCRRPAPEAGKERGHGVNRDIGNTRIDA